MTEHEWLVCTDPEPMLEFLHGKASDRKLRLFACACCRHTSSITDAEWKRMVDHEQGSAAVAWPSRVRRWISGKFRRHWPDRSLLEWSKREAELAGRAAALAEKVADGLADLAQLKALLSSPGDDEMEGCYADGPDAAWAAKASAYRARHCAKYNSPCSYPPGAAYRAASEPDHDREQSAQADLLRDIFGNPFRLVAVEAACVTADVAKLAETIYKECAFNRLPVLAEALERAGCHNAELLSHCRAAMPHVRGCWALDLILGKE
jgi:hypothetical protein